jgi:predicted ATPase/DNA-binding CsgD family transcriptional regulator
VIHNLAVGEEVKLSRRAKEIAGLVALGLTNREIAARLFLSERTIEWHIEQILNKLGFSSRSQIAAWIGRTQVETAVAAPGAARRGNLPAQITSFVGRQTDLRALLDLVSSHRLVTVTGPGGIGKTRLALRLAEEMQPELPHGAWLCDLASVADPNLVADAVAQALGVNAAARSMDRALRDHLNSRSAVIVLDSCEHVLASSAALVQGLLTGSAGLRILATSRVPLGLIGEAIWRLPPLQPDDAARLFEDRAAAAAPGVVLSESSAAVEAICRRLDGVPLAIELVVPRLRVQTPAELAEAVLDPAWQQRSQSRHGSLESLLEWSYRLMSSDEQALLRLLGVFSGWFEASDAVAITPSGERPVSVVLGTIAEQSMVIREPVGHSSRYRLLEIVKAFARRRLDEGGELEGARELHANHLLRLVPRIDSYPVDGPARRAKVMSTMVDDVRSALDFLLRTNPRKAAWMSACMMPGWSISGRVREGVRWSEQALEANPGPNRERCWNLFMHAGALGEMRQLEAAEWFLLEAELIADAPRNEALRTETLIPRSVVWDFLGKPDAAVGFRTEAIENLERSADASTLAVALNHQAMSLLFAGRPNDAARFAARSIEIERRLESGRAAYPLETLAQAHVMLGELEAAAERWLDVLHECAGRWDSATVADSVFGLALVAGLNGRREESLRLYYLGVRLQADLDAPYWAPITPQVNELMARLEAEVGEDHQRNLRDDGAHLTPEAVLAQFRPRISTVDALIP